MKKYFFEKILIPSLALLILALILYFNWQGKISFLPLKKPGADQMSQKAEVLFREKEFRLSYGMKHDASLDIANFEEDEPWSGDMEFDNTVFLEGNSSLFLTSRNHQRTVVSLEKRLNVTDVSDFNFLVYLETKVEGIEELNLIFENKERDQNYQFPIRGLIPGWNFLTLPRKSFSLSGSKSLDNQEKERASLASFERIVIELISRPGERSSINLDSLWAEKGDDFLNDWNTDFSDFLSIKKNDQQENLFVFIQGGVFLATIKEISSIGDGLFQAKFTPLKEGFFGFFLRGDYKTGHGYYLKLSGVGTDSWEITKNGVFDGESMVETLGKGEIKNFEMKKNNPYWLRAEMRGMRIIFSFSLDGKTFTQFTEVKDRAFSVGGLGFFASGPILLFIDDFQFFQ